MSDDVELTKINARIDMLSMQILQVVQMAGQANEKSQQNQREVINYVTKSVEELTQAINALTLAGHDHGPESPDASRTPNGDLTGNGEHPIPTARRTGGK